MIEKGPMHQQKETGLEVSTRSVQLKPIHKVTNHFHGYEC